LLLKKKYYRKFFPKIKEKAMKKSIPFLLIGTALSLIIVAGCSFPGGDDSNTQTQIAQTMVAMGLTQTAMENIPEPDTEASPTDAPPEPEETAEAVTVTPTVEITHNTIPSNPGWINKWFYDTNSSRGTVTGGDDFMANLYERPFTESDMVYRPDIDIIKTEISEDGTFYYVTLYLYGSHPEGGLRAAYGVEIDLNQDGRGEYLIMVDRPAATDWDIAGVSVHKDTNKDVGGSRILRPDTNYTGDGYDQTLFSTDLLDDPDMAWARITTGSTPSVTLAFKKSVINQTTFVWGVWAADSLLDPTRMDLHDHFTQSEAGSPYPSHSTYPLGAINLVDNTCRETYQFEAVDPIPGLCYTPEEEPPPPPEETEEPTEEPSPEPETGEINGVAFDDMNNDGNRDSEDGLTVYDVTITLRSGGCGGPVIQTTRSKAFTFSGLEAGDYCVSISPTNDMTTASSFVVSVPAGGSVYVEFGYTTVI
jgi:hypothetical protein